MKTKLKTVMCFGTFDLLHLGHLYYLQQAKKYGDYLTVVIARDKTKWKQKKKVIFSEQERLKLVQSLKIVDKAILGDTMNHLKVIIKEKPDTICLGYDHPITKLELQQKLAILGLTPNIKRMKSFRSRSQKSGHLKAALFCRK